MRSTIRLGFRFILLLSLVLPLQLLSVSAGVDQWTSNGPEGGVVNTLAIAPSDPNIVYAGTSGGGVYKTTDGGAHWAAINGGLTSIDHILSLTVDPLNPNLVYAGNWSGMAYKSTDGGGHWASAFTGQSNGDIHALAIDPSDSSIIYAGGDSGLSRSMNGGTSWALTTTSISRNVYALAADSRNGTIYAGTSGGLFKSANRGASWDNLGLTDVV